jgi:uncharacterized SAM-binding protein YcdF (DUF218 family)
LVLIPPVNCLFVACVGVALGRRRFGRPLAIAGLAGLLLFSLPIVATSLMAILEAGLNPPPAPAAAPKAIVILSGDQTEIRVGPLNVYRVGTLTLEREQAGAVLARRTGLPLLVTGGALSTSSPPIGDLMTASMAQDFGLKVTWTERASADTWANAQDSAAILRKAGISSVYVVTHAWHMKRALLAFRRAGLTAAAAPVAVDAAPQWRASAFVPLPRCWLESYWAIHELIGWAWYAIRP